MRGNAGLCAWPRAGQCACRTGLAQRLHDAFPDTFPDAYTGTDRDPDAISNSDADSNAASNAEASVFIVERQLYARHKRGGRLGKRSLFPND